MKKIMVPLNSDLDKLAESFFQAAKKYWDEYQKSMGGMGAVVWVEDPNRGLIVFTRGEYADDLKEFVEDLPLTPRGMTISG